MLPMPIFRLVDDLVFPPPDYADPSGLIAVGGDLSSERLLEAYRVGIFPWYSEDQPHALVVARPSFGPDLEEFKIRGACGKTLKKEIFRVTFDRVFEEVIAGLRGRAAGRSTGYLDHQEMQEAYINFHGLGYAHSVETWFEGKLVGGLYGVSLGKAFFGESMFHRKTDASKVRLATSGGEAKGLGLSLHRLADDDGAYA